MSYFPSSESEAHKAVDEYLSPCHRTKKVGGGVNGLVYYTSRGSAVKILSLQESFERELKAYRRIEAAGLESICGFTIPHLLGHSHKLQIVEMTIVQPPFLLDFASCCFDIRPRDMYSKEWEEQYEERIQHLHEDRASKVFQVYNALASRTGIYHTDLRPTNIGFVD